MSSDPMYPPQAATSRKRAAGPAERSRQQISLLGSVVAIHLLTVAYRVARLVLSYTAGTRGPAAWWFLVDVVLGSVYLRSTGDVKVTVSAERLASCTHPPRRNSWRKPSFYGFH